MIRKAIVLRKATLVLAAFAFCVLPCLGSDTDILNSPAFYLEKALTSIAHERASISIVGRALSDSEIVRLNNLAKATQHIESAKDLLVQKAGSTGVQTGIAVPSVVHPDGVQKGKRPSPENKPATEPDTDIEKGFQSKYKISPKGKAVSYLKKFAGSDEFPSLQRSRLFLLKGEGIEKQFPERIVYVLRFMQFPVPVLVPQGLASNTILVVDRKGAIEKILDEAALKQFFVDNLKPSADESRSKDALASWLLMVKELAQDGMYQFKQIDKNSIRIAKIDTGCTASGVIEIVPRGGNEGAIEAVLTFDKGGRIQSVVTITRMNAGIRPICQSHRLLDTDPVLRQMAERDLLVMGKMCKDYLLEQRKNVSPALKREIDRIWLKICERESNVE